MLKKVSHANYLTSLHGAFGKSEEAIYFNEFVDVEERSDSVFISMSQDLIYNINQEMLRPQNIWLYVSTNFIVPNAKISSAKYFNSTPSEV